MVVVVVVVVVVAAVGLNTLSWTGASAMWVVCLLKYFSRIYSLVK